ncbi:hypothetical protein ULMS_24540 [Patiriisocius marinistellae]|uniref:Uncharacterized protein n=1 Tax=Patiriisocius marinistellae TaxID=2494560 RepID=A0A5J4G2J9_9FLAO|nr:hypothetical protein [Patiriisocius marinistellae]GEQ86946.1 hypothetical protein ULMS_24540 [Patiriisocius marinistellae]
MEPIKFEENSREKFEERELQPSAGAWDKLEAMLEKEQPIKKTGGFPWLAIAASFIGFVIIASIYFNQNDTKDSLVNEDIPSEILKEDPAKSPYKTVEEIQKEKEAVAETVKQHKKANQAEDEKVNANENQVVSVTNKNTKIKNKINNNNAGKLQKSQQVNSNTLKNINNTLIDNLGQISALPIKEKPTTINTNKEDLNLQVTPSLNKVDAVVAQIKDIKNKNGNVTENEINALLATAQEEIKLQRLFNASSGKVDAMALLGEVEMEMQQSFREKVFYALGEGFEQLRTTIADRNN